MGKIEIAWQAFERLVVPPTASAVQRTETRKAFFAGASVLFMIMTRGMSDGPDVEAADLAFMDGLSEEIDAFGEQIDAEVLLKHARGQA
jgi:pyruvoyl-dependent arginine decarboxylase (PvlArgDC)